MRAQFFLILLTLMIPSTAQAQSTINAENAAHLKSMFQDLMDKQTKATTAPDAPLTIEYQGEITVEPAGNLYNITLPGTIMHFLEKTEDGTENHRAEKRIFNIGKTALTAAPHHKPKQWLMNVTALPTPITITDGNNKEEIRLNIGHQTTSGIWHEDFQNFIKLDANYNNITANINGAPNVFSIENVSVFSNLTEEENTEKGISWSGPSVFTLSNLQITPPEQSNSFKIGKISMKVSGEQFSQDTMLELQSLLENPKENTEETLNDQTTISLLANLMNGLSLGFSVSDIEFSQQSKDEMAQLLDMNLSIPSDLTGFLLKNLYTNFTLNGIMEDTLSSQISFGYTGLDLNIDAPDNSILPSEVTFSLETQNIPIKQITTLLHNELESTATISPLGLVFRLPAILSAAGTQIQIHSTIGNDLYRIETKGRAETSLTAVNSATAEITTRFTNIDIVLAELKKEAANPENPKSQEYNDFAQTLEKLKEIGIEEQDPTTLKPVHVFKLIMNEKGEFLLNDQPALPILGTLNLPTGLF